MMRRNRSVARLMVDIAILAIGLNAAITFAPPRGPIDLAVPALALALTVGADRVVFGRGRRVFWLGFTVTGWLVIAAAWTFEREIQDFIRGRAPSLIRVRDEYVTQRSVPLHPIMRRMDAAEHAAGPEARDALWSEYQERYDEVMRQPEIRRLRAYASWSVAAELAARLALGLLAATAGGLFAVSVRLIARRGHWLAERLGLPPHELPSTL